MTVDGAEITYDGLPENHRETMRMYLEHGYPPGSGWRLILYADLAAVCACDDETVTAMPQIYRWMHNNMPPDAWGSRAKVNAWMNARCVMAEITHVR